MSKSKEWFSVDKEGFAQIVARRGLSWVMYELYQNAVDERSTEIRMSAVYHSASRVVEVRISDDNPEGFADLRDAFVLYKPSRKRANPEQRGRYNAGEKQVLSLCRCAEIVTTTGGVRFDADGRHSLRRKTDVGSVFTGEIPASRAQYDEMCEAVPRLIVPPHVRVYFNNQLLTPRAPLRVIEGVTLQTDGVDAEGRMVRTRRKTAIEVYAPSAGESPALYEMGIPVMPLEDTYSVSVQQKVPLDIERSSVPPSYLRAIRTAVLAEMADELPKEAASAAWVDDALESGDLPTDALNTVLEHRFGARRVVFDPSDLEANHRAAAQGYTVVPGGALSRAAWASVRAAAALLPAGRVTPTPRPFTEDGKPLAFHDETTWTAGMRAIAALVSALGERLMGRAVRVRYAADRQWPFSACYGEATLIFNAGRLGKGFFARGASAELLDLIVHELAHEYASNHLDEAYHRALTRLAGRLARLALDDPALFARAEATTMEPA